MGNYIFIGMPASGKSTLGRALAKKLGYKFIDGDKLIEDKYKKSLKDIISDVGNDGFTIIEDEVNSSIYGNDMVIAPGGSVVFCENAMEHFKKIGTIIYIKTNYYTIASRIRDPIARGIVLDSGETLKDVFHKRKKYFEMYANIIHKANNISLKNSLEKLLKEIEIYNENKNKE